MSGKALDDAQALIDKYTAKEQQAPEAVLPQTVIPEESATLPVEATPIVRQVPAEVVNEPQPAVSQGVEVQMQAMQAQIEKMEQSYKSLQGKYNKELPDARNDSARLKVENDLLKDQLYQKQAAPVAIPQMVDLNLKERLGQDKVDELGENYIEMVDEATQYQIQQALAKQEAGSALKIEAMQKQMDADKWSRYNQSVGSQVPNFISLIDPLGDGRLDVEFGQFLNDRFMLKAFDEADVNMNSETVVKICDIYNNHKTPPVQAPTVVPHNPKAQAVAPTSVNTSSPQLQPQTAAYTYKLSDYITNAHLLASCKMSQSQWLAFEAKYNQAVAEGLVNLTA